VLTNVASKSNVLLGTAGGSSPASGEALSMTLATAAVTLASEKCGHDARAACEKVLFRRTFVKLYCWLHAFAPGDASVVWTHPLPECAAMHASRQRTSRRSSCAQGSISAGYWTCRH